MARLPKPRPPRGGKRLRSGGLEVLAIMGIPTGTRAGRPTYSHHRRKWQTLSPPHHAPDSSQSHAECRMETEPVPAGTCPRWARPT